MGFNIKRNLNGTIYKYITRLVAKGYHQIEGLDFDQVFSLVVKPTTVRLILTISILEGYQIRPFDFNNAFSNGDLLEVVFMQ